MCAVNILGLPILVVEEFREVVILRLTELVENTLHSESAIALQTGRPEEQDTYPDPGGVCEREMDPHKLS